LKIVNGASDPETDPELHGSALRYPPWIWIRKKIQIPALDPAANKSTRNDKNKSLNFNRPLRLNIFICLLLVQVGKKPEKAEQI